MGRNPNNQRHSMNEDLLCGGQYTQHTCLQYKAGVWKQFATLVHGRIHHVSWRRQDGAVKLIGGHGTESKQSTEDVTSTSSQLGYSLGGYTPIEACAIQLPDFVLITGGATRRLVRKLSENTKSVIGMPDLNQGRAFHACGYFYESATLTYLVTGGYNNGVSLSSTEIMSEFSKNWIKVDSANLPSKRTGPRGISLNNEIFVTGGAFYSGSSDIYSDILVFDKVNKKMGENWRFEATEIRPCFGNSSNQ